MKRFILNENIRRFRLYAAKDISEEERSFVTTKLAELARELALIEAASTGAHMYASFSPPPPGVSDPDFLSMLEESPNLVMIIDPSPGLRIVYMNQAFADATLVTREDAVGRELFELYPDNPEEVNADGISKLYSSLRYAVETRKPHHMAEQRYDIRDAQGNFVERYWTPINTPVFDDDGKLVWILHEAVDVTERTLDRRR